MSRAYLTCFPQSLHGIHGDFICFRGAFHKLLLLQLVIISSLQAIPQPVLLRPAGIAWASESFQVAHDLVLWRERECLSFLIPTFGSQRGRLVPMVEKDFPI